MLKAHERIDCLIKENLKVIQNDDVFSFSTDALLLGYFTEVRKKIQLWICVLEMVSYRYYYLRKVHNK